MIDQILDNHGYFRGHASYELAQGKNKKKASIIYNVHTGPQYYIDTVMLMPDTLRLYHLIDSVVQKCDYMRGGSRYDTDSLNEVRVRIANALRNKGYYFFKPDYVEYLADSTITPQRIALRVVLAGNIPKGADQVYTTGTITTRVLRNQGGGTPDTMHTKRGTVIQMKPSRLRQNLIPSCIRFREGKILTVRDMNRTQTYLSRLGIFNGVEINVIPDTTKHNVLNVDINCTFDKPMEASIEVNATSKSNSYIGPGVDLKLTSHNLFGGGEQLNIDLTGSYEWQTGRDKHNSVFNSYEIGLNTSLAFPRLLAPRFIPRTRRELSWTRITLGADLLNRPHYFRMAQFNASFNYDWRVNRYITNTLTLFKLTYTKLLHTTHEFDSIMSQNRAIALSFQSQFIPQIAYTYNYDRYFDRDNGISWTFTVQEAGNVFWAIWQAAGKRGKKNYLTHRFPNLSKAQPNWFTTAGS